MSKLPTHRLIQMPSTKFVEKFDHRVKQTLKVEVGKELKTYGLWNEDMMDEPMEKVWLTQKEIKPIKKSAVVEFIQQDMFKNL
jgi:hypothetical protein